MSEALRKSVDAAKFLARHPSEIKYVRRRASTVGKHLLEARVPWLPYSLQDHLQKAVPRGARVFEYGGGGSTVWLLDQGYEVYTVEHDESWFRQLTAGIESECWTGEFHPSSGNFSTYVSAIQRYEDDFFDLVIVDGRERVRCFLEAMPKIAPGGYLLLDDTDRDRYRPAFQAAASWGRTDFHGLSPGKLHGTSTLWRRPSR